jgi:hypothetical protein
VGGVTSTARPIIGGTVLSDATKKLFTGTDGSMKLGSSTSTALLAIGGAVLTDATKKLFSGADGSMKLGVSTATALAAMKTALTLPTGIKYGVALPNFSFVMFKKGTNTPQAGLTPTVTIKKDAGAFAAPSTPTVTEIANGWYSVSLAIADMTAAKIAFRATDASNTADDTDLILITNA